jgi:cytochrome c-type biogenesis protein CcmH/NrfG
MGLKPSRDNRRRGDAARDLDDWTAAERNYRQHLVDHPSDADIWVQLGHCHKEQGQFKEAEACYRRAIELRPRDSDAPLHLGHALKLQGMSTAALEAYRQSYDLAPAFAAASEIEALGGKAPGRDDPRAARASHLFVIDDLFVYLTNHKTVSGIQRVIAGIAREILSLSG